MTTDGGDTEPTRTGSSVHLPHEPDRQRRRYATDGGDRPDEASVDAPERDDGTDDVDEGAAAAESTVTESGVTVERLVAQTEDGPRVTVDLRADETGTRSVRVVESFGAGADVRDVRPLDEYREDWAAGPDGLEFRTVLGPGDETRTAYGLRSGDAEALTGEPTVEVDDLAGSDSGSLLDRITGFLGGSDDASSRSEPSDGPGTANADADADADAGADVDVDTTDGSGPSAEDDGAAVSGRPGDDGPEAPSAATKAGTVSSDGSDGAGVATDAHGGDGTGTADAADADGTDAESEDGVEEATAADAGTSAESGSGAVTSGETDAEATRDADPDGAPADDRGRQGAGGLVLPEALVGADTIGEALVRELEGGRIDPEVVGRLLAATGGEAEVASWDRVDELEAGADRLADRVDAVDDRLDDVGGRVDGLDERLAAFDEATPSRSDHEALADRVGDLEADVEATDDRVDGLADRVDEADDRLADLDDRLAVLEEDLTALRADVDDAAAAADLRSLRADVRAVREDVRDLEGFQGRVERLINIPEAPAGEDDDTPESHPGPDGDEAAGSE
jgi:hypothetical protein